MNSSLPQYQTNAFWVNDTRMVSWENFSNITPQGATVNWSWISPKGVSYTNTSTTIPTSSGGYSWYVVYAYIPIRNQLASTLPGSWQIIVDFDGAQAALQNFTIQSSRLPPPLTIENSTLSTSVDTTSDAPVNITTSFSNTSPAVYSWLNFTNVPRPEQNVTWTFIMPNGTEYLNQITYMTTDPGALGQWPFWTAYAYSSINGYPAANVSGAWQVDVYIDGRPSLIQNFTIS